MLSELLRPKESPPRQQPKEAPLMFVDVSSAQQTPEAPKKADYYSDKNSKAANLEPPVDSTVPKITGDQTQIVKTEDVPRSKAFPLNPAQPAEHSEPKEEAKPKPAYTPGDLTMAKPEDMTRKEEGTAERARPRTLQEARARQSENRLAGKEMRQEGGVRRRGIVSLDVMQTSFGGYDAALIAAVQNRWYNLLDSQNWASDAIGKATVRFLLHSDGSISQLNFGECTVSSSAALLCQSAIKDPAPYAPWPSDMKHSIGSDDREITFIFYYTF